MMVSKLLWSNMNGVNTLDFGLDVLRDLDVFISLCKMLIRTLSVTYIQ